MNNKKFVDLFILKGKMWVGMTNKKGQTVGVQELTLRNAWIKVPKKGLAYYQDSVFYVGKKKMKGGE